MVFRIYVVGLRPAFVNFNGREGRPPVNSIRCAGDARGGVCQEFVFGRVRSERAHGDRMEMHIVEMEVHEASALLHRFEGRPWVRLVCDIRFHFDAVVHDRECMLASDLVRAPPNQIRMRRPVNHGERHESDQPKKGAAHDRLSR